MNSVGDLINDLSNRNHPMLTWYGPDHERVDLTGKTVANWIIKAANLLMMDLDCPPKTTVWLDLPTHWRTIVWAHALWCAGATWGEESNAEIAITASPSSAHQEHELIVIALPALARSVDNLPPGAIDGAGDLMNQPDSFVFPPPADPTHPTGLGVTQEELLLRLPAVETVAGSVDEAGPHRVLIPSGQPQQVAGWTCSLWAHGHSVVISKDTSVAETESITHITAT